MNIKYLLNELDGEGMVITDSKALEIGVESLGLTMESEIESNTPPAARHSIKALKAIKALEDAKRELEQILAREWSAEEILRREG